MRLREFVQRVALCGEVTIGTRPNILHILIAGALATAMFTLIAEVHAQGSKATSEMGVNVIVNQLDVITRAWGMHNDKLDEVARQAARSQGWDIDPASKHAITVSITPLRQQEEDLFDFKVEVSGGSPSLTCIDGKAHEINAMRVVRVSWNDHEQLVAAIDEMVRSVAHKLKARIPQVTTRGKIRL